MRKDLKKREARKGLRVKEENGKKSYVEDDRFDGLSKDVKKLLRYRAQTIHSLEQSWKKKCKECDFIKPLRTHHCQICNTCVFHMDHHCRKVFDLLTPYFVAWINNCLGLENYRYFLLFILYLLMGCVYMVITIISIWNHHLYKDHKSEMSFIVILDGAMAVILLGFNGWNWFLAMTGLSTIEFWGNTTRSKKEKYDFSFKNIRDNLYKTFGTQSFFQIFSPSLRNLPFNGIEWSY
jgi:hypothetical protein